MGPPASNALRATLGREPQESAGAEIVVLHPQRRPSPRGPQDAA